MIVLKCKCKPYSVSNVGMSTYILEDVFNYLFKRNSCASHIKQCKHWVRFLFNILVYNGRNKFVMLSTFSIGVGMEIAESVTMN